MGEPAFFFTLLLKMANKLSPANFTQLRTPTSGNFFLTPSASKTRDVDCVVASLIKTAASGENAQSKMSSPYVFGKTITVHRTKLTKF